VIIDVPFSFVADTLCLPFDAISVMVKPEPKEPDAKVKVFTPP